VPTQAPAAPAARTAAFTAAGDDEVDSGPLGGAGLGERASLGGDGAAGLLEGGDVPLVRPIADGDERRGEGDDGVQLRGVCLQCPGQQADAPGTPAGRGDAALLGAPTTGTARSKRSLSAVRMIASLSRCAVECMGRCRLSPSCRLLEGRGPTTTLLAWTTEPGIRQMQYLTTSPGAD